MASLTPGTLSKLIDNAANTNFRVAGDHRSPLLQVIEILPSLPGAGADDPWRSHGFFLKVSDSLHAAYASISDEDLDLIYSDKIKLGQFVYVSRLDSSASGSRVPILRGLKPVPKRKPCVGNPTELVSSDALPIGRGVGFSKRPAKPKPHCSKKNVEENKAETLELSRGESRRLSLDSARRGWDYGPPPSFSSHIASPRKSGKKPPISRTSPLKSENEKFSQKAMGKVTEKILRSPAEETRTTQLIEMPLNVKARLDKKISWSALQSAMAVVGKRAVRSQTLAYMAAVHALEEASAIEGVLQCMCLFTELSESSQQVSAGLMAEKFLELYEKIQQAQTNINSLLKKPPPGSKFSSSLENATPWIQAAIATNLSKFSLFRTETFERHLYVVVDNSKNGLDLQNDSRKQTKPSLHRNRPFETERRTMRSPSPSEGTFPTRKEVCSKREEWSKGSGVEEAAKLADELLSVSRQWFVNYLENLLSDGFKLSGEEQGCESLHLLGQIKRVNQWMDELIENGVEIDDRIGRLRKKLYRFLLEHVDMAAHSSK